MKQEFSTSWIRSTQPRKQRKYNYNAPLHIRHKFLSANLSKALREKYGKRSLPLRKGDEVLIMRGSFKKKKAKVSMVNIKRTKIALEGIQRSKKDGAKVNVFFHPSVLQIQSITTDTRRLENASKDVKEVKETKTEVQQEQKQETKKEVKESKPVQSKENKANSKGEKKNASN